MLFLDAFSESITASSTDWWLGFLSLKNLMLEKVWLFAWKERDKMRREDEVLATDMWSVACIAPSNRFLGWIVEEFHSMWAKPQNKPSCSARNCSFSLNFRQVLCGLSLRRVKSVWGAGHFSITNAGKLSSPLNLTKKWLYMLWVYALTELRNPGQVSKCWIQFWERKWEPFAVFVSELTSLTLGWIYPLVWLSCFWFKIIGSPLSYCLSVIADVIFMLRFLSEKSINIKKLVI